ncbi:hypothetical protein CBOM_02838 [Ceraceosorus bombacis]|uniref:Uncharacterized protein n=1 Tax=Ceraceosorus bombacis TaxID=401625 RepID=A0A0P1BH16_9BASI|nr:hypothetical protein CBOM_02838 [Ceraceosorus bombacis]
MSAASSSSMSRQASDATIGESTSTPKRAPSTKRASERTLLKSSLPENAISQATPQLSRLASARPNAASILMREVKDSATEDFDVTPRKSSTSSTPSTGSSQGTMGKQGTRQTVRPSLQPRSSTTSASSGGSARDPNNPSSAPGISRHARELSQSSSNGSSPMLKHRASTNTIRKGSDSRSNSRTATYHPIDSLSNARDTKIQRQAEPGSLRDTGGAHTERLRRSEMRERELEQMRSESRLGRRTDENVENEEDDVSGSDVDRLSQTVRPHDVHASPGRAGETSRRAAARKDGESSTATDTSGTEGAGSSVNGRGQRRRKKSSSASASSKGASRSNRQSNEPHERPATSTGHTVRTSVDLEGSRHYMSPRLGSVSSGDGLPRSQHAFPPSSTAARRSAGRAALPSEFRADNTSSFSRRSSMSSRFRSNSLASVEDTGEPEADTSDERRIMDGSQLRHPSSADASGVSRSSRRRYMSDASSDIPTGDYSGRAGTQSSRLSVDSSSASRHLGRGWPASAQADIEMGRTDNSAQTQGRDLPDQSFSPSEMARQRKISTSSSVSQRSSGGASDLLRSVSRASVLRAQGTDVFDASGMPPLPHKNRSPISYERDRALRVREEQFRQLGFGAAGSLDRTSPEQSRPLSRTSSRASARPSSRSGYMSRELEGFSRAAYTEPRRRAANHERAATFAEPGQMQEAPFRHASLDMGNRPARTPNLNSNGTIGRTRDVQSAILPTTDRFFSGDVSSSRSASNTWRSPSGSSHEQNLSSAYSMFERYFSGSSSTSAAPIARYPESMSLVLSLRHVTDTAACINAELEVLRDAALQAHIDAERGGGSTALMSAAQSFSLLEQGLIQLRAKSDEQVRSLTDSLVYFARTERERDAVRKLASENGSVGRPGSRISSLGTGGSPLRPDRASAAQPGRNFHTSSHGSGLEVPPSAHSDDRSEHSSASGTIDSLQMQRVRSHRRHATELASPNSSSFAPSPTLAGARPGQGATPHARVTSPLESQAGTRLQDRFASIRDRSGHGRAASEASNFFDDSPRALERAQRERERSNATVTAESSRPSLGPTGLSPRRSRLSFPAVNSTNAAVDFGPARGDSNRPSVLYRRDQVPSMSPSGSRGFESPDTSLVNSRQIASDPSSLADQSLSRRNTVDGLRGTLNGPDSPSARRLTSADEGTSREFILSSSSRPSDELSLGTDHYVDGAVSPVASRQRLRSDSPDDRRASGAFSRLPASSTPRTAHNSMMRLAASLGRSNGSAVNTRRLSRDLSQR